MKRPAKIIVVGSERIASTVSDELSRCDLASVVKQASDRGELWQRTKANDVDCVITESTIAGASDFEFLNALRERRPELSIIIVSTDPQLDRHASEAIRRGADDFIAASDHHMLGHAVERAIRATEIRRENKILMNALSLSEDRYRTLIEETGHAATELRTSEENYRSLIQATTQFVWTADEDGYSEEVFAWLGDLSGRQIASVGDLLEALHPDDRDRVIRESKRALETRSLFDQVCRFPTADSSIAYLAVRAIPTFDGNGEFRNWIGTFTDISQRILEQEAVRHSEEKFRDLFENANDLIYTHDLAGNFTSLNRAGELITGYTREETESLNIKDVVVPEYLGIAAEMISAKLNGDPATSYETAIFTKSGRRVLLDLSTRLIYKDGKPVAVQGIARDITEKKRGELALRSSEKQLRIITDTIPVSITHTDADGTVRFANQGFLKWLGKDEGQVIGQQLKQVLGPKTYKGVLPEIERVMAGETLVVERNALRQPAGGTDGERFIRMNYVPEFDDDGNVVSFYSFMTDLTENKRSEQALRKSEEQLQIVTDTVPVLIAYFDRDQKCTFANRSYLNWLGKSDRNVIGRSIVEIQGAESYEKLKPEIDIALSGNEVTIDRPATMWPEGLNEQDARYFRVSYVPDTDREGSVHGYFIFAIDMTENKRAEEALRKSEELLLQSQKLESVGRLAGGIAHDFNNMLTAINGYSDLTLRKMEPEDPLRRNIEEIKKAGERSAELTNQLLAFSRRQILQPRVLDLNRAVADLIPMLERLIGADVDLRTNFSPDSGTINADPGQLSQVLMNLVINARDSITSGGSIVIETRRERVTTATESAGGTIVPGEYAVLSITDTGIGMDPQMLTQIFEPFFTTKEMGKGTGLGLSTVHGIVLQSGGNVLVESKPGKGSRFQIYLPMVGVADNPDGSGVKDRNSFSFGSETILLVEDEKTVRELGREILEACGYSVITAEDGVSGLRQLDKHGQQIDLVMTDVVMPNLGGRELAAETNRRFPNMKVLFSSGYDNKEIVRNGALPEGTNFIQKPFTFDALAMKIRELLDKPKR
jgi:two-component system cell cycle sensor histidine kinase/response regulator CckA